MAKQIQARRAGVIIKVGVAVLALAGLVGGYLAWRGAPLAGGEEGPAAKGGIVRWTVQRHNLTISALAPGELKTKNMTAVRNETDRTLKITWIAPEGLAVTKGETILELDNSELTERYLQQKISLTEAQQRVQEAEGNLAIAESKLKTDVQAAENKLSIARIDLQKYIEGDFQQQKRNKESSAFIAEEERKRAMDRLEWTQRLYEKSYVTKNDLDADEFAVKKSNIQVEQSKEDLKLLEQFAYTRELTVLQTAVVEADGHLEEVRLTGERDIGTRKAALDAARERAELERITTENLQKQLDRTIVKAPEDGLVVYHKDRGRFGQSDSVLQVGTSVSPRQWLIDLPDFAAWIVEARVHESMIQKIRLGQPAFITLDALSGQIIEGVVSKISVLPDSTNFMREVQEYLVEIDIGRRQPSYKPGMSGKAEIVVQELKGVLVVPIQAVQMKNARPAVWLAAERGGQLREIEVGLNNGRLVEVVAGLKEGDVVIMEQALAAESGLGPRPSERASPEQRDAAAQAADRAAAAPAPSSGFDPQEGRGEGQQGVGPPGGGGRGRGGPWGGMDPNAMTPEQREEMMRRMEERMNALPPEEREAMQRRMEQFQNGGSPFVAPNGAQN